MRKKIFFVVSATCFWVFIAGGSSVMCSEIQQVYRDENKLENKVKELKIKYETEKEDVKEICREVKKELDGPFSAIEDGAKEFGKGLRDNIKEMSTTMTEEESKDSIKKTEEGLGKMLEGVGQVASEFIKIRNIFRI